MKYDSHFNFYDDLNVENLVSAKLLKLNALRHLEEMYARSIFCLEICILVSGLCLLKIDFVVHTLQVPAIGVKFMQLGPGEYFITSVKVAASLGFLVTVPITFIQLFIYFLPGFTKLEVQVLIPCLVGSIALFNFGMVFAYGILVPAALQFFIAYGSKVVEPIWSFAEYFKFISRLLCTAGLSFQLPILQVTIGILSIVSSKKMFGAWKHIILFCVLMSAVLTPSTDPITQIIMSGALLTLYSGGYLTVLIIEKGKRVL